MKIATFSELRNNAKKFFDAVENGEEIEVYRHGKPIAIISPIRSESRERWKRATPMKISGISLSQIIISDRKENK